MLKAAALLCWLRLTGLALLPTLSADEYSEVVACGGAQCSACAAACDCAGACSTCTASHYITMVLPPCHPRP